MPSESVNPLLPTRIIPATGESIPVVGLGTWSGFDVSPGESRYAELPGVLDVLFTAGASVIDSSPMYGRSEQTVGELLAARPDGPKPFIATKVWTTGRDAGIAEMKRSLDLLGVTQLDLMQIHNLVDWRTHLVTIRDWKERGTLRYIGVTHYKAGAHGDLEAVLRSEKLDFVQVNYSMLEPEAGDRLLPLAADLGVAVLANRPFGEKSLAKVARGRTLPAWASEVGARSWNELAIAFALSHDAVTCTIPGTANAGHMRANIAASGIKLSVVQQRELIALLR